MEGMILMYNKDVIEKAYKTYLEKLNEDPKIKEIEEKAVQAISTLRERIANLPDYEEISFIHEHLFGEGPNAFAAPMAIPLPGIEDNLHKLLKTKGGKKHLRALFPLLNEEKSSALVEKIEENSLVEYVNGSPEKFSPRPRLYASRLELMLFPELFTTVADFPKIKEKARLLGFNPTGKSFEEIQYLVRSSIDHFLEERNLKDTITPFQAAALAWEIGV
jgi:hypothetical protein